MDIKTYPFSKKMLAKTCAIILPIFLVVIVYAAMQPPIGWLAWLVIIISLLAVYAMCCLGFFIYAVWTPVTFGGVEPEFCCSAKKTYNGFNGFTMKVKYIQSVDLTTQPQASLFRHNILEVMNNDPIDPAASKRGHVALDYFDDLTVAEMVDDLKRVNNNIIIGSRLSEFLSALQ